MKTEEAKLTVLAQIRKRGENYKTGVYQTYAIEELGFTKNKAERFAAELDNIPCQKQFRRYQTTAEMNRLYFWYYMNYCATFFFNGFAEWLKVHHRILQYLQTPGIELAALAVKTGHEEEAIDIYKLAERWANEFELRYSEADWNKKDFDQTLTRFCKEKNSGN